MVSLEVMIDSVFTFFWKRWKHRYSRMEKNMAKTLFNCIVAIKNIDFHHRGAKPPIDHLTFYKLMVCWQFKPFHGHFRGRR